MRLKIVLCTIALLILSNRINAQERILIAAASDLRFAMDSLIGVFAKNHPGNVKVTYGSSGKLTEQIINGAPFDVFFSADIAYPEKLRAERKTSSDIYAYAKGHLVIWSKKLDPGKKKMNTLLDPSIKKIAVANPAYAPYGKRAIESLKHYRVLDAVKPKLVYGENISQTAQFVSTGAADIGIIALSLALSPNMQKEDGEYFLLPEDSHDPLIQGAVITARGRESELAASFFEFVKGGQAIAVLNHFGFSLP